MQPTPPAHQRTTLTLVVFIALFGPLLAYAGVQLLYSESDHIVTVGGIFPVLFEPGADYPVAEKGGFATNFTSRDQGASFSVTLKGISGGNISVDSYAIARKNLGTQSYKIQLGHALTGSLSLDKVEEIKLRLWNGNTVPLTDESPGVCAAFDLSTAQVNEESATACTAEVTHLQVILRLRPGASGTSNLSIRPSSIVFH
jgi:hypothetical protein